MKTVLYILCTVLNIIVMGTLWSISNMILDELASLEAEKLAATAQSQLITSIAPTYEAQGLVFFIQIAVFIAFFIAFIKVEKTYRSRLKPWTVKPS